MNKNLDTVNPGKSHSDKEWKEIDYNFIFSFCNSFVRKSSKMVEDEIRQDIFANDSFSMNRRNYMGFEGFGWNIRKAYIAAQ